MQRFMNFYDVLIFMKFCKMSSANIGQLIPVEKNDVKNDVVSYVEKDV